MCNLRQPSLCQDVEVLGFTSEAAANGIRLVGHTAF